MRIMQLERTRPFFSSSLSVGSPSGGGFGRLSVGAGGAGLAAQLSCYTRRFHGDVGLTTKTYRWTV